MKLCVSHSWEDQEIAGEVAAVCEELGIDYILDGRDDWLRHGLHPGPEDVTHHAFIVTSTNERSWWLPFQLGRSRDSAVTVLVYLHESVSGAPSFVRGDTCVSGFQGLRTYLGAAS